MSHQYQPYQQPGFGGELPAQGYPAGQHFPHSPGSYNPQAAPQYQQHNMNQPQHPNTTYQPQQPMSEKPQPQVHAHAVNQAQHNHSSKLGSKWLFGLFDCFSPLDTCCLSTWCPCILFGKTYAREHGDGEDSGCNLMCLAHCCAINFGVVSCLQCIVRGQQREKHGIESNALNDYCISCWCSCCALIQEEKESIVRITGTDPKTKVAYQPIKQGMQYPA